MKTKSLEDVFADDLRDPEFIRGYLQVSWEEDGPDGFLWALQRVVRANPSGIPSWDETKEPDFRTVLAALDALGVSVRFGAPNEVSFSTVS
jgi:DNA-binding phage protein